MTGSAPGNEPPPSIAIRLRDVTREYRAADPADGAAPVRAVDRVSLDLAAGERVAIVGPSCSGKSTLLHLMAGIDVPSAGEIWVAGASLAQLDDDALTCHRRDHIGLVFQAFHLLPTLTARENVALPALLAGERERDVLARAERLLDEVGLAPRRAAMPHTLSGGEQQRVALARALLRQPAVLLADEPTGNLDSSASRAVLAAIMELSARHGATVVMVTHSAEAAALAERTVELRDGRVVEDRTSAP